MPKICTVVLHGYRHQCQDILMHLLYNGGSERLLCDLIVESMNNIASASHKDPRIIECLRPFLPDPSATPLVTLRASFILLLNMDERMRSRLCKERVAPYVPSLCPHKACVFYTLLKNQVVLDWMKNESVDVLAFVEKVKETYLLS